MLVIGSRDIRAITGDDIYGWAELRRAQDGIQPKVINRNDLIALKSVFGWAAKRQGGRLIATNPATGVRLDEPREVAARERTFRDAEIDAILGAALKVQPCTDNAAAARARR